MPKSSRFLTDNQIKTLDNVLIAAGQITAGSIAAPYLFPSVDKPGIAVLVFGVVSTIILWTTPIIFSRRLE